MMMTGRRGSIFADAVEGVEARHVGQAHVEDDRVRLARGEAAASPWRAVGAVTTAVSSVSRPAWSE